MNERISTWLVDKLVGPPGGKPFVPNQWATYEYHPSGVRKYINGKRTDYDGRVFGPEDARTTMSGGRRNRPFSSKRTKRSVTGTPGSRVRPVTQRIVEVPVVLAARTTPRPAAAAAVTANIPARRAQVRLMSGRYVRRRYKTGPYRLSGRKRARSAASRRTYAKRSYKKRSVTTKRKGLTVGVTRGKNISRMRGRKMIGARTFITRPRDPLQMFKRNGAYASVDQSSLNYRGLNSVLSCQWGWSAFTTHQASNTHNIRAGLGDPIFIPGRFETRKTIKNVMPVFWDFVAHDAGLTSDPRYRCGNPFWLDMIQPISQKGVMTGIPNPTIYSQFQIGGNNTCSERGALRWIEQTITLELGIDTIALPSAYRWPSAQLPFGTSANTASSWDTVGRAYYLQQCMAAGLAAIAHDTFRVVVLEVQGNLEYDVAIPAGDLALMVNGEGGDTKPDVLRFERFFETALSTDAATATAATTGDLLNDPGAAIGRSDYAAPVLPRMRTFTGDSAQVCNMAQNTKVVVLMDEEHSVSLSDFVTMQPFNANVDVDYAPGTMHTTSMYNPPNGAANPQDAQNVQTFPGIIAREHRKEINLTIKRPYTCGMSLVTTSTDHIYSSDAVNLDPPAVAGMLHNSMLHSEEVNILIFCVPKNSTYNGSLRLGRRLGGTGRNVPINCVTATGVASAAAEAHSVADISIDATDSHIHGFARCFGGTRRFVYRVPDPNVST